MTHQSLILLATLLMMAGFSFGYWLGWAWDAVKPYVAAAIALLKWFWLDGRLETRMAEFRELHWAFLWDVEQRSWR